MDPKHDILQIPVFVEPVNGHFVARLAGRPELHAESTTREGALEALRKVAYRHLGRENLTFTAVEPKGPHAWAGVFKDDPTLDDICREAYRQRDESREREFDE